jgi:hypothetical protein
MKTILAVAAAITLALIASAEADTTIDPVNRYAWAANTGFTDWRPSTAEGVNIGANFCSGFIYAANVGWVKMGTGTPANGTSYSNASATDFGVNCAAGAAGEKNLRGFAYGANIGWVNFEPTGNPRIILSSGRLRGFAWSANAGWINLDDANVFVATAPQASPTPSATATATPGPTATATPGPTATATPGPSATATPGPSATSTPGPSATATPGPSATSTPGPSATATATTTPTATPIPSATATASPTATPTATPGTTPDSHLANISTRMRVETGDNVLIAGFIVEGPGDKKLIVRGIGPSLEDFGVADALQDPTLELYSGDDQLAVNDNWPGNPNAAEIVTSGLAPRNLHESALLVTLAPGSYTAVLRGNNGGTGVGLVELYDLDTSAPAQVVNTSTRGFVLTGENVMIGGFIITGNDPSQLVVRAVGPSLDAFGVPDPLADPFLEVHDGNGATIQTNNDWRDTQEAGLQNTGLAPSNELESAILISVAPGNYTAIMQGADGGIGNGLVEVYTLSLPSDH